MPNAPITINSIPLAHKMQGFAPPPHPLIRIRAQGLDAVCTSGFFLGLSTCKKDKTTRVFISGSSLPVK